MTQTQSAASPPKTPRNKRNDEGMPLSRTNPVIEATMMLVPIANLAAAAVTAVLAASSGRNMLQTWSLSRQHANGSLPATEIMIDASDSTNEVVSKIQSMKRKELLELYMSSRGPQDLSEIAGEWNGHLLDNDSWIMTAVTGLLSNRMFGMGRKWNGKQFGKENDPQLGINRFHPRNANTKQQAEQSTITPTEHTFDMILRPSKLGARDMSLVLDYTKYQFPLSLWRTMMDEVRIVPLDNGEPRVLIGLGYMAWSGGRMNSSPFVLYRAVEDARDQV
ncbi:expressed unknown protein [Seminavis robusta]|uniref:Uncharacterized protein n=1 Tax=Seminavis robusta TaxID=568900 RepID=A0A9N8EL18_9STRA|nr:expressed unknown protein [Seminavis robusta]|eukprot:Sro1103_g241750.1 n/a (277) ;mRNA; f:33577-34503